MVKSLITLTYIIREALEAHQYLYSGWYLVNRKINHLPMARYVAPYPVLETTPVGDILCTIAVAPVLGGVLFVE